MAEEPVTEPPKSTVRVEELVIEASESTVEVQEPVAGATESILEAGGDKSAAQDMDLDTPNLPGSTQADGSEAPENWASEPNSKRKEGEEENAAAATTGDAKKQKIDKSVEEERLEKGDYDSSVEVKLGPKTFKSSLDMFNYFHKFLHFWKPNLNANKYEHMVLLDLLKKGHLESDRKIGKGVSAFQVRYHPHFKSRCFFIIREDGSVDDFSFRKCVDNILPLPEGMQIKPDVNKRLGGSGCGAQHGGGRKGGHGRGCGKGGRSRK